MKARVQASALVQTLRQLALVAKPKQKDVIDVYAEEGYLNFVINQMHAQVEMEGSTRAGVRVDARRFILMTKDLARKSVANTWLEVTIDDARLRIGTLVFSGIPLPEWSPSPTLEAPVDAKLETLRNFLFDAIRYPTIADADHKLRLIEFAVLGRPRDRETPNIAPIIERERVLHEARLDRAHEALSQYGLSRQAIEVFVSDTLLASAKRAMQKGQ